MVRYNFVCRRPGRVVPLLFAVLCVPVTAFSYQIDIHVGSDDWGKDVVLDPWGNIVAEGRTYFQIATWIVLFPGLFLAVTVLAINLLGDGLRDLLDPRHSRI